MRAIPALLTLVLLVQLAGCTDDDDGAEGAPTTTMAGSTGTTGTGAGTGGSMQRSVDLYDNFFEDGNLTDVAVGTRITYENEGTHGHTVTIHWVGDPLTTFKIDQTLQHGESTNYTFSVAGTYHVFCRFHGTMTTGMATVVTVK